MLLLKRMQNLSLLLFRQVYSYPNTANKPKRRYTFEIVQEKNTISMLSSKNQYKLSVYKVESTKEVSFLHHFG